AWLASLKSFSDSTLLEKSETSARNGAQGSLSVITTVKSPRAKISWTGSSAHCHGPLTSWARLSDQTTSAAFTGSPVEKRAFRLREKVHVLPSATRSRPATW